MTLTYKVLAWINLLGLVVVLGLVAYQPQTPSLGGSSTFSGPVNSLTGYQESGTSIINDSSQWVGTINTSNAATFTGGATWSTATSTHTAGSIWNTTSTGVIFRAPDGNCYLLGLNASITAFTTSTRPCAG